MKLRYLKETDTFYMIFSENKSIETVEISDGVMADLDKNGNLVGIEYYSAKGKIDFDKLQIDTFPFKQLEFNQVVAI